MAKQRVDGGRGRRPNPVKKGSTPPAKNFYVLLAVIAVVAAALIGYQLTKPTASPVLAIDPNTPLPKSEGYLLGDSNAPVQVIEFADFECPGCADFATVTEPDVRKRLVETGLISFRFIDFPLAMHRNTWDASNAAACANEQGKFWEMHDGIFATQDRWGAIATNRPKGVLEEVAKGIGLDVAKWEECFDTKKFQPNIMAHEREAQRRRVGSTPTFIIGNRMIPGSISYDKFKAYVDSAAAEAPKVVADSANPAAK